MICFLFLQTAGVDQHGVRQSNTSFLHSHGLLELGVLGLACWYGRDCVVLAEVRSFTIRVGILVVHHEVLSLAGRHILSDRVIGFRCKTPAQCLVPGQDVVERVKLSNGFTGSWCSPDTSAGLLSRPRRRGHTHGRSRRRRWCDVLGMAAIRSSLRHLVQAIF